MREWTKQAIEEHKMLKPGGRVIAALSGGADSVCLLALLSELKEELGFALRAVHVHHGLRGQEADRDADFSATICEKLSVPCHIIRVNVRAFAREQGLTEEEAGRRLRIYQQYLMDSAGERGRIRSGSLWPITGGIRRRRFSTTCSGGLV